MVGCVYSHGFAKRAENAVISIFILVINYHSLKNKLKFPININIGNK